MIRAANVPLPSPPFWGERGRGEGRALTRLWLRSPLRGKGQLQRKARYGLPLTPDPSPPKKGARGEKTTRLRRFSKTGLTRIKF